MNKKLRLRAAMAAYSGMATYLMFIISNDMFLACLITAVIAYLLFMAIDHHNALQSEKAKRRSHLNYNSNRLYKHRFWFWFSLVMYSVLVVKVTQLVFYISGS